LTADFALVNNARIIYEYPYDSLEEGCMVDSAELFEAISHPTRIKILKILEKQPASFAFLKRQLNIESSGNLDYHLKKLTQLIAVREDGLYGLTDAGKEALLSIETIELWTEMERRKIKTNGKLPWEASLLVLLELGTATATILWFFSTFSTAIFPIVDYFAGSLISAIIAFLGFASVFGILAGKQWSWKTIIAKSALMMLSSLIPLVYLSALLETTQVEPQLTRFYPTGVLYAILVVVETIVMLVVFANPVKDYLGAKPVTRLSRRALLGGAMSIVSGILTTVSLSINTFHAELSNVGPLDPLTSIIFASWLAVGTGGVLILLRSYTLGALMSIIFGLFPYPAYYAVVAMVEKVYFPIAFTISVFSGLLPIIGGILALVSMRKIRD
jgi:DNA-binding transcriptional ArsR family regulator